VISKNAALVFAAIPSAVEISRGIEDRSPKKAGPQPSIPSKGNRAVELRAASHSGELKILHRYLVVKEKDK
jgi:hypothetical protein